MTPTLRSSPRSCASPLSAPFLPGTPLSLSLLAQDGAAWLLSCNRQHVTCAQDTFTYLGGGVGGAEERRHILEPLAARIAEALPGLWGYVGVDLIDNVAAGDVLLCHGGVALQRGVPVEVVA